ncbi:hypothetical protein [Cupriavidus oxalaticus]|uniref:Uncharacterized protein n=1 Tax=Cupriavidus oxalaticus TaxID=96344 RepID=A0A4P7LKV0_9BURK|nr:hypothetical protein [Cupriavidus oxalaticus]QBY56465.1 hypothetical protein E0W60_36400 [Cupriavidus oxalaticus]
MEMVTYSSILELIRSILKGLTLITGVMLIGAPLSALLPMVSTILIGVVAIVCILALFRPLPEIWLGSRWTSAPILLILVFLAIMTSQSWDQQQTIQADRLAADEKSRLIALRSSDPTAYLAELKTKNSPEYEGELRELKPAESTALIAKQATEREVMRVEEIARLKFELIKPYINDERAAEIYRRLASLEPSEKTFADKADQLERKLSVQKAAADLLEKQRRRPKDYVSLSKTAYRRAGFGTILEADFTIKNDLPWPIKDITLTCELYGASETKIDSNTRTIYERIEPKRAKIIKNFSMGFIHSQSSKTSREIDDVVVIR